MAWRAVGSVVLLGLASVRRVLAEGESAALGVAGAVRLGRGANPS